jgi:hypothetical protein
MNPFQEIAFAALKKGGFLASPGPEKEGLDFEWVVTLRQRRQGSKLPAALFDSGLAGELPDFQATWEQLDE